jgi:hypothetical protein
LGASLGDFRQSHAQDERSATGDVMMISLSNSTLRHA